MQRSRHLIVDGFNVLRSSSRYQDIKGPNPDYDHDWFNRARDMLINDLAHFADSNARATLVFDGGGNVYSTGQIERVGGIEVVFSQAGASADKLIEKMAFESREHGLEVLVVTSDASIQDTVFGQGVDRMSAEGFSHEIERYFTEAKLDDFPKVSQKRTLAERIDVASLEKLKALRDGHL